MAWKIDLQLWALFTNGLALKGHGQHMVVEILWATISSMIWLSLPWFTNWLRFPNLLVCELRVLMFTAMVYKLVEGLWMLNALHWYLSNYRTMLSHHDYKLASRFTAEDLGTMTMRTKRQWIHHLDVARTAYNLEKATMAPGQQLLTNFSFRGLAPQLSSSLSLGCVSRGTYSIINHSAQDTVHICAG